MVWHFIPSLPPRTRTTTQPPTSKAWPENCHMMAMTQPQEQVAEQFIQSTLLPILRNYLFNTCSKWTMDFSIKCPSLFGLATSMSKEIHQKVATVPASVKVSKRSETEEREKKQRSVELVELELVFIYCLLPSLQPASLEFCMLSPFETFTNM